MGVKSSILGLAVFLQDGVVARTIVKAPVAAFGFKVSVSSRVTALLDSSLIWVPSLPPMVSLQAPSYFSILPVFVGLPNPGVERKFLSLKALADIP